MDKMMRKRTEGEARVECTVDYVIKDGKAYLLDYTNEMIVDFEGPMEMLTSALRQEGFKGEVVYGEPEDEDEEKDHD